MRRAKANSKRRRGRKIVGLFFLALLIGAGIWTYKVVGAFTKKGGGSIVQVWQGITNPRALFPGQDRTTILIIGKDYNYDSKDQAFTKDSRADTIMLLSADLEHGKLTAVGIPRDTHVTAPDGITGKINATFARGGLQLLKQTIANEFGFSPDHYVILKSDAVKKIVDAVGGVDVEAIDDMFYQDSWGGLNIDLKKGHYHIDGTQAVGFVRFRKTGTHEIGPKGEKIPVHHQPSKEEGDIRRAERQQQLVHALVSEGLRPQNIMNAEGLINVAFAQLDTDLTRTQALALATIFKKGGSADLAGSTIPGKDATIDGIYYWDPDLDRTKLTLDWLLRGNEEAGRQLMRIVVVNASAERGATKPFVDRLKGEGYSAVAGGSTHDKPAQSELTFRKAAFEPFARAVAQELGIQNVHKDTGDPRADWLPEVRIVISDDLATKPAQ